MFILQGAEPLVCEITFAPQLSASHLYLPIKWDNSYSLRRQHLCPVIASRH